MFRAQIKKEIEKIVPAGTNFNVTASDNLEHGDYSSNVALILAKKEGKNPREVAEEIKNKIVKHSVFNNFERIEIAGPGFLNFFIARATLIATLQGILNPPRPPLTKGGIWGDEFSGKSLRVNLEFVSANPTGPLTMANGRGGFYGDALANIFEAVGHEVTREYYVNDTGNQVKLLGESILAAEGKISKREEYYKGEYIKELKEKTAKQAAAIMLREIKNSLKNAGIKFNVWFSEDKNLHKRGELKKVLEFLKKKKMLEEKDGALWLGNAVLIKSNGEPTYFLADLAYHYDKFIKRKFDLAIDVWGADHHGYVERMKNGISALGVKEEKLKILILQLVRLMSKGKEIRMSKRAGNFITLDELLKEIPVDVARWFFLEKSLSTHMDFDLDLARERSKKNPVYYVQYAHARACSILRKGGKGGGAALQLLQTPEELNLIKKILQLPEIIEDVANDYQVNCLTRYSYELAQIFTAFYEKHKVIDSKNPELSSARLALVFTTQKTLNSSLKLLGIKAPEKM